ncbi:linear amide C-N hydrolase [Lacticaseibacillus brantae]|nr:linear amide C-N hydrolase [Lacticaseibacillus brantae]
MCTGIRLSSTDGKVFWGRTMDLAAGMFGEDGNPMPSCVVAYPQGIQIKSVLNSWQSKYAVVGVGGKGTHILYDGVNEAGLAGDIQVLMECTRASQESIAARGLTPVIGEEFVTYVLSQYASVAEIRADYQKFALLDQPLEVNGGKYSIPAHYTFVDETGDSIVLEPVNDGAFKLYDNIGVVTNSPEYGWQTTNLRNYMGMTDQNITADQEWNPNLTLHPIEGGTGYGLYGLPGDFTSVSRFTRAAVIANHMDTFTADQGLNQLYAAFRSVIIPRGLEHANPQSPLTDYTRYWVGYDLSQRTLVMQTGNGLAFNEKAIDQTISDVTYFDVDNSNAVHAL